jgi:hypothetical protein
MQLVDEVNSYALSLNWNASMAHLYLTKTSKKEQHLN